MYKRMRLYTPIIYMLMALCAVLVLLTLLFNRALFYISAAVTLFVFVAVLVMLRRVGRATRNMLEEIGQGILHTGDSNLATFPFPVITVYDSSEIIWYNDLCRQRVFTDRDVRGEPMSEIIPGMDIGGDFPDGCAIAYNKRRYTAYISRRQLQDGANIAVIYLVDDTQLKHYADEYHQTRPSIAVLAVDNYEEMLSDYKDSERAQLMGEVEYLVEQYIADHNGFVIRMERDKMMAVIEERGLQRMIGTKFDLLDKVRALHQNGRMGATLSMGVGRDGSSLYEIESMARQALDMCLGRGGDQVAIKTQNGYEFYGGISKGIEKRTKVKTRIIATALSELVDSSSNVIIMGHRFADLDCLGSAIGMFKAVKAMQKPVAICIHPTKNLVRPLLEKMLAGGYLPQDFVAPEDCMDKVHADTLLIVLDTHVPHVLESEELYRACRSVAVIDHHRKLVNHIDNAVIFYHEPYASSASEMVAELLQYFPARPQIGRLEAEAMLAGVMLDTKNFVMRTGVRTFEAAAYLRRLGADTVEVRKLFSSSMEAYQQKANMVASAVIHHRCAIAATTVTFDGIRMVAPQAADELLTISGVDASFIIFLTENQVNISARSMGALNVQVIMEQMGGGGHQNMAAAQFPGEGLEGVRLKLLECIDQYIANLNQSMQNAAQ